MKLPLSIVSHNSANTCEIILDVWQDGQEDTFPTLRIGQVAVDIVNTCLVQRMTIGADVSGCSELSHKHI